MHKILIPPGGLDFGVEIPDWRFSDFYPGFCEVLLFLVLFGYFPRCGGLISCAGAFFVLWHPMRSILPHKGLLYAPLIKYPPKYLKAV